MPPIKQAAVKHANQPDPIKEERRAYEHLGRVEALHPHLDEDAGKQVHTLVALAHAQLKTGHAKGAADLLRAAEHLSFGALHAPKPAQAHPKLRDELKKEFEHKLEKAEEHWNKEEEHDPTLEAAYLQVREQARALFADENYRQALEVARGAEALAHVKLLKVDEHHPSKEAL